MRQAANQSVSLADRLTQTTCYLSTYCPALKNDIITNQKLIKPSPSTLALTWRVSEDGRRNSFRITDSNIGQYGRGGVVELSDRQANIAVLGVGAGMTMTVILIMVLPVIFR